MKPVFKANDGSEHETEAAALLRNELVAACSEFQSAGDNVRRLLGASALTADGQPFDCRKLNRFYWIGFWDGWPEMRDIDVYWYQAHVDHQQYSGESHLTLTIERGQREGRMSFRINELYASKKAAEQALVKVCEEKLAEYAAQLDKLKQRVFH